MPHLPARPALLLCALLLLTVSGQLPSAQARPRGASRPDCGPPVTKTVTTYWVCTFADDFDGAALDPSKWLPITTADNGVTAGGACYRSTPSDISVSGGYLSLSVRREAEPFTCLSPKGAFATEYSAGQVATYGRFAQTYGRFAVRAAFPAPTAAGLQSTLWMWPQNPLASGTTAEIDIAEQYSFAPQHVVPFLHYVFDPRTWNPLTGVNGYTSPDCVVADVNAFHEYLLEWTPTTFTVRYDGQTCLFDKYEPFGVDPFQQPFFLALSQALGVGPNAFDPATTPLPATTTVDWVRAWK